jgi:PAS domain S-box-containing protein
MKRVYLKVIIPSIVSVILFVLTIFLVIIPRFRENIMEGKQEMIKELTNSAWSILAKYENDEKTGELSRTEAQKTAISRIQYLRYGAENKDYFWITDLHPNMIMHPYRSELNSQDLSNFSDPHGKKLFVEFVNMVKQNGQGYVNYMWQWKEDSLHIVPKLSYVKIFQPWGWIIGTGVYIEDVKKEISGLTKKLIWISTGISIIIAFLLFLISKESLKIEQKRAKAVNELNESREKYRTLVEAATEGLIMLSDGKIIYLNTVIGKLTGFAADELINKPILDIICETHKPALSAYFTKNSSRKAPIDLHLKQKSGGFVEILLSASTTNLGGKEVNIIIIKDLSAKRSSDLSAIDYQKLLNTLDIGFFRTSLDSRGRFIFANDTTIRILGFEGFRELSETNLLRFPVHSEDRKMLRKALLEDGFVKQKIIKILRRNGDIAYVNLTLVLYKNSDSKEVICDGVIEEITLNYTEKLNADDLISKSNLNRLILEQPIVNFLTPVTYLDSNASIGDVINIFSRRHVNQLLITINGGEVIGFISESDIQKRVLSLGLHPDNPAYLIMSSPLVWVNENCSLFQAVSLTSEKRIRHLVVKNSNAEITGIVNLDDLLNGFRNSISFLEKEVPESLSQNELCVIYHKLQFLIKDLINTNIYASIVTRITSSFSDKIITRLIELNIEELGKPPVEFAFICMGSVGRGEETLLTDQDNAIIFGDTDKQKEPRIRKYFELLGKRVCDSLNDIGYSSCKGNIMASNPQWCQPISMWENYFSKWISEPDPRNLLDAMIFFDLRFIYGNSELTEKLTNTIETLIHSNQGFIYHLAQNTSGIKIPQIGSMNFISDKSSEMIDLKNAVNLIMMFARTYSLANNVKKTNTLARLKELNAKGILNDGSFSEIKYAFEFLMGLRLKNQVSLLNKKSALSNLQNLKDLPEIEIHVLRRVLGLFPVYQNRISTDFRISTFD